MIRSCLVLLSSVCLLSAVEPVDLVDPMIGTTGGMEGCTHPSASLPFGMVKLGPVNALNSTNGFSPKSDATGFHGFAFNRFSGTGGDNDLGNLLITPLAGSPDARVGGWRTQPADRSTERARPESFAITFADGAKAEMTAGERDGLLRFTFPADKPAQVVLDAGFKLGGRTTRSAITILDASNFEGWLLCDKIGGIRGAGNDASFRLFFRGRFDRPATAKLWTLPIPFDRTQPAKPGWHNSPSNIIHTGEAQFQPADAKTVEGDYCGTLFGFPAGTTSVSLRVAISYVDAEGARKNFAAAGDKLDFDAAAAAARKAWSEQLGRWTVEGGSSEERRQVFYTALYHASIDPHNFTDVNGRFYGIDHQIHTAKGYTQRTIFSGWDVYRSLFPLLTLLRPDVVNDQVNTLLHHGQVGKMGMPEWEFMGNYWNVMLGDPAASVIADAYTKGIRGYDAKQALERCVSGATTGPNSRGYYARDYNRLGYAPNIISGTTELAYGDWAIARLAEALGDAAVQATFDKRGGNWRNTFDPQVGWMRRRNPDGTWNAWKDYTDGEGVIESTILQQSFFVPHDVPGLMEAMGGKEPFLAKLGILFDKMPEKSERLPYGRPWGSYKDAQYTHDNEPVHFVPFMFNAIGEPWLTQKWSRYICEKAYTTGPRGLVGNDDAGQMSAWYVLAASGLHPLAPGDGRWQISSPEFERVTIRLDQKYAPGKTFVIISRNWSPKHPYIQSATLNGKPLNRPWLSHAEVAAGGELALTMGPQPSRWGANQERP